MFQNPDWIAGRGAELGPEAQLLKKNISLEMFNLDLQTSPQKRGDSFSWCRDVFFGVSRFLDLFLRYRDLF